MASDEVELLRCWHHREQRAKRLGIGQARQQPAVGARRTADCIHNLLHTQPHARQCNLHVVTPLRTQQGHSSDAARAAAGAPLLQRPWDLWSYESVGVGRTAVGRVGRALLGLWGEAEDLFELDQVEIAHLGERMRVGHRGGRRRGVCGRSGLRAGPRGRAGKPSFCGVLGLGRARRFGL